jgi:hypothetical protein
VVSVENRRDDANGLIVHHMFSFEEEASMHVIAFVSEMLQPPANPVK